MLQIHQLVGAQGLLVITTVLLAVVVAIFKPRSGTSKKPPCLPETVPYVSNTYQYITNQKGFLDRAG